jgi:hypothetical protein
MVFTEMEIPEAVLPRAVLGEVALIEGQLGPVRSLKGFEASKPMGFALEKSYGHLLAGVAERCGHGLGLSRGHDRILRALKEQHRRANLARMVDRRALSIELQGLGQGAHQ